MIKVDIYNKTAGKINNSIFLKLLKKCEKVLAKAKIYPPGKIYFMELTIINEKEMKILNHAFRGQAKSTDVISLSYFDKKMKDNFAGEIFICLEYAKRQAVILGNTLNFELQFLFIHGLLHLFGLDHKKKSEAKRMNDLTEKILINS